ncbi:hypothetical protein S1361_01190 [Streptomyces cyanogenus]|uniref:Uncharacterized protein n=1 Tax=Streptomyces cyanogenus TaxID=80860 RepID=A0ABX7THJ8_STRCY|nr:hypothetical protein S1361_01190 [Streptomyces cyanogenus]
MGDREQQPVVASRRTGHPAFLTRHLATKSVRDGVILGAAVGFAASESAGYAFTALFRTGASSPRSMFVVVSDRRVPEPTGLAAGKVLGVDADLPGDD